VHSDGNPAAFNIVQNDCIGADFGAVSDLDRSQYFCPGPNINLGADVGQAWTASASNRDLLKYEAIDADFRGWMYDDAVGVRHQQASPDVAIEGDVGSGHNGPELMAKRGNLAKHASDWPTVLLPVLILPD
jgi:hypothetical protein